MCIWEGEVSHTCLRCALTSPLYKPIDLSVRANQLPMCFSSRCPQACTHDYASLLLSVHCIANPGCGDGNGSRLALFSMESRTTHISAKYGVQERLECIASVTCEKLEVIIAQRSRDIGAAATCALSCLARPECDPYSVGLSEPSRARVAQVGCHGDDTASRSCAFATGRRSGWRSERIVVRTGVVAHEEQADQQTTTVRIHLWPWTWLFVSHAPADSTNT